VSARSQVAPAPPFEVPASAEAVYFGPVVVTTGNRWWVQFPNGFAGSVIDYGAGSHAGLFEVAVMWNGRVTQVLEVIAGWPAR
jgi:hypothetical protein